MNVWIVTRGSYSDYKIEAVFDTEEQAREFDSLREGRVIETWTLNAPNNGHLLQSGFEVYAYRMNSREGWQWHISDQGWEDWDIARRSPEVSEDGEYADIHVLGEDRDHARKIAQDLIAESNARREGLT